MPTKVPPKNADKKNPQFRGSLVRTVVAWLLIFSLVPVSLMGAVTYFRSQAMLKDQVSTQLQLTVDGYVRDVQEMASSRQSVLVDLLADSEFTKLLDKFPTVHEGSNEYLNLRNSVYAYMDQARRSSSSAPLDEIMLIDGKISKVIISTDTYREGYDFQKDPRLAALLYKSTSSILYRLESIVPYNLVLVSTQAYTSKPYGHSYSIVGITTSPTLSEALTQASKFYDQSRAYFFLSNGDVVGMGATGALAYTQKNDGQSNAFQAIKDDPSYKGAQQYTSVLNQPVLSYAEWLPDLGFGMAMEVPTSTAFQQVRAMAPLTLLIVLLSLLLTGASVAYGTFQIVRPLTELSKRVQVFAQGAFDERAQVTRNDEIGLLAHSFNRMAEQLTEMYRSLESKVEERNQQLLTAAEVAQIATSNPDRQQILKTATSLLVDRFGYDYACLYLLDSSNTFFTTAEASGALAKEGGAHWLNIRIRNQSAFGLAIQQNHAQVIDEVDSETGRPETLLPDAKSEIILPVSAGDQIIGVLDIQSANDKAFPQDVIPVLTMLSDQIANGLQNIHLVENAQVDLRETNLIYQASRQVTQSNQREEVWKAVLHAVEQTAYTGILMEANDTQLKAVALTNSKKADGRVPTIILTLDRFATQLTQQSYLIFDNLSQASEYYPIFSALMQHGCSSAALVPILVRGKIDHVLALGSRDEKPLNSTSLQPYLNLTEVISNTLERVQVLNDMQDNLAELKTVALVSQSISVETDLEQIYKLVHEQILNLVGGNLGFYIALYDPDTDLISFPYNYESGVRIDVAPFHRGEGLTSYLIEKCEPLLLANNATQKTASLGYKIVGNPARSWLGVPLVLGGKAIGAMVAEDNETDNRLGERELHLFTTLAPEIAVAIRNAQLLSEMQAALKQFEQERFLLNTLLDNIPESVYFKDQAGKYIRVSASYAKARRAKSPEELIGKTEVDVSGGTELSIKVHQHEMEMIEQRQIEIGTIDQMAGHEGKSFWLLTSRLPMMDVNDQVVGLLGLSSDITGLKQAEQLAQKRSQQLRTAAEIARDTSGTLDIKDLLERSVNLVRDRFGFYHASIFLLDQLSQYAVLRESTGEAGRQMKSAGHRLAVGSNSIVGQATGSGEARVVNDVTSTPNYFANPLLPDTRSEMAIPLKVGDRIIGAIDVQSTQVNSFDEEDINILRILADQLAVAIVNADLFAETEDNIAKHRFLHQITTAAASATSADEAILTVVEGMRTALGSDRVAIYLADNQNVLTIRASAGYEGIDLSQVRVNLGQGTVGLAALGRHPVLVIDTHSDPQYIPLDEKVRSQLALPIVYTDRSIGVLVIESLQPGTYDENDYEILGSLGSTLGSILANTQLMGQIRRQVDQQKQLFEITSKIRRSTDVESVMRTSARELATALHAHRAHIRLIQSDEPQPAAPAPRSNGKNGHQEA